MPSKFPAGPSTSRLTMAVVTAVLVIGWGNPARAGESAPPAALPPPPTRATARPEIRAALREFDRFLDHHPVMEDRLRLDPKLAADNAFLELNPELHDFLGANPNVTKGLKRYPLYYLNRALLRQASVPLAFRELAPFRDLFLRQPNLAQALIENPEEIREPAFLASNPPLRACFARHPVLARAFVAQTTNSQLR